MYILAQAPYLIEGLVTNSSRISTVCLDHALDNTALRDMYKSVHSIIESVRQ